MWLKKFQSFKDSKFQSFEFTTFQNSNISRFQISTICKSQRFKSHKFKCARFLDSQVSTNQFSKFHIFKNNNPKNVSGFLDFQRNLVYPSPHIRVPKGSKNARIMQMEAFGLSHNQIEKLSVPNEAESSYGAFKHFSIHLLYK